MVMLRLHGLRFCTPLLHQGGFRTVPLFKSSSCGQPLSSDTMSFEMCVLTSASAISTHNSPTYTSGSVGFSGHAGSDCANNTIYFLHVVYSAHFQHNFVVDLKEPRTNRLHTARKSTKEQLIALPRNASTAQLLYASGGHMHTRITVSKQRKQQPSTTRSFICSQKNRTGNRTQHSQTSTQHM